MSVVGKKRRAAQRLRTREDAPNAAPLAAKTMPILRAILPGALMYQAPQPAGIMAFDPPRRSQFNALQEATVLATVPREELAAVLASAAKTYTRSFYHECRYADLRRELDRRRELMPGEIVWDSLIEYVHFELQAFTGSCRTLLDELVYLIARRHSAPPNRARRAPWETADLFKKPLPAECDVPEVQAMRKQQTWFDTLNAFRNTFFHHGWRHGGGHFSPEDLRKSTQSPSANGLLVPDRASLVGRSKPFEWTWSDRTTVDDIARDARAGTEELIKTIFEDLWATPIPPPGTAPLDERPNMLVGLVRPAVLEGANALYLPFFSERELARQCKPLSDDPQLELVDAPTSTLVVGQRAVSVYPSRITSPPAVADF